MNKQVSVIFLLMGIIMAVALVLSNILAVKQFTIFGYPSTAGLLTFPITYVVNDCIAEVWGYKKARLIIWVSFATNFLAVLLFQISIILPPAAEFTLQDAYASILSQTPRIVVASLIAFLVGSFLNAYVMSKMKILHKGKKFGQRAIASTVVGELADSFLFTFIAFLFVLPAGFILKIVIVEAILKTLFEIVVLPITTLVVKYVKTKEQIDVFDENVSYNVMKVRDI